MATTTNDAIYLQLSVLYPDAGKTLGDLLYTFWVEKGLESRGTLAYQYLKDQGAIGDTLGDLFNSYFNDESFFAGFDAGNIMDWLELEIFGDYDVEEEVLYG